MTTGKTRALTRQTFVNKVLSLLFNMLSMLVITFLPRSKCLLISWQQSPSAVIWDPPKIKSLTVSIVSPSICHEVMGLDAMILVFWILSFKATFVKLAQWTIEVNIKIKLDFTIFTQKLQRCIPELIIFELFNSLRESTNTSITFKMWLQSGLKQKI